MKMKNIVLTLSLALPLYSGDIMVERMQSVVDEVSELRKRYEDSVHKNEQCLSQVKEQNELLSKKGLSPRIDKKKTEDLESEVDKLNKENIRLNTSAQILVEKNQSLLEQVKKLKRSKEESTNVLLVAKDKEKLEHELSLKTKLVKTLEKKNTDLEAKLKTATSVSTSKTNTSTDLLALQDKNKKLLNDLNKCKNRPKTYVKRVKTSKGVCIDGNPFPKLLKKEKKSEPKKPKNKPNIIKDEVKASSAFRIKGESAVYDKPKGSVIEVWEDTRSFTSNVSADKWVKITGYFVDRKWRKAKSEMWVKEENTLKR